MRISDWSSDVCSSDLLVVRFEKEFRESIDQVRDLFISLPGGGQVPLREVAEVELRDAPAQISRDNAKRRIVIGVNTRGGDTDGIVEHIRERLESDLRSDGGGVGKECVRTVIYRWSPAVTTNNKK